MQLPIYQIDAFTSQAFKGNPAAIVPLTQWLDDESMQAIAEENNLAETAFFIPCEDASFDYYIRWFTPTDEVKLCGHATIATAFVLFEELGFKGENIRFNSLSGLLGVSKKDKTYTLNFPAQPATACAIPDKLIQGLGLKPEACFASEDYLAIVDSQESLEQLNINLPALAELDLRGIIVSAPAKHQLQVQGIDFVARFFAPAIGIDEDPVTGSAYTELMPYWAARLGKQKLSAMQLSKRTGMIDCELLGDRVNISGSAVKYLQGEIIIA